MGTLDDLLKRAASFVEKKKGRWDDAAWASLVSDVRQKGVELSGDVEAYFGSVLESMKRLHASAGHQDLGKNVSETLQSVSAQTAKFVQQSKGMWDHSGWEKFLSEVQSHGVHLSEEVVPAVGDVLESAKRVYQTLPFVESKPSVAKSPAAKPAPKAAKQPPKAKSAATKRAVKVAGKPAAKAPAAKKAAAPKKPVAKPAASATAARKVVKAKSSATTSSKSAKASSGKRSKKKAPAKKAKGA